MGKMYTLDQKLLVETPEVRIGEKVYPIDNRTSTVKKLLKDVKKLQEADEIEQLAMDELIIKAAFNKNAKKILEMDLPFEAQTELSNIAMNLMIGDEVDEKSDRFQGPEAEQSD